MASSHSNIIILFAFSYSTIDVLTEISLAKNVWKRHVHCQQCSHAACLAEAKDCETKWQCPRAAVALTNVILSTQLQNSATDVSPSECLIQGVARSALGNITIVGYPPLCFRGTNYFNTRDCGINNAFPAYCCGYRNKLKDLVCQSCKKNHLCTRHAFTVSLPRFPRVVDKESSARFTVC